MSESRLNEDGQNEQQRQQQQQQQQQQDPLSRTETSASNESSPDESTIREDKEENDNKHSDKHSDNNKNKNSNKKSKKRKRGIGGKDISSMILELRQERYDKLLYMARKQLHKQAKQVRTFLIQKSIRKQKEQQNRKPKVSSSSTAGVPVMIPWKELPLDEVVHQALKQLGILHANPNPDSVPTILQQQQQQRTVSQEPTITTSDEGKKRQHHDMIQQCLAHKSFQKTLEEWNVKVTEYRRWSLQLDEKHNSMMVSGKKNQKNKNSANISSSSDFVDYRQHRQQQPTSMFCSLGGVGTNEDGEIDPDNNDNEWSAYGPAATSMDAMFPKKKNRKGQRARKAKALALEAKRKGNKEYQSLNWRSGDSKKKDKKKESDHIDDNNKRSKNNHSSNQDASEREVEAHPSWVAKKEQQTGIVAFQGTKITFD